MKHPFQTNDYWFKQATRHMQYVQGLLEGNITSDACEPLTVAEALAVEQKNVVYCLNQIG